MALRNENLLNLRPIIPNAVIYDSMSKDERFQNTTLRPVIKLQSELLVEAFKNYANKHKGVFYSLSLPKKMDYIENVVQKDMKFRNSLKGMIIGQFTIEEYLTYTDNSSALNKRMMKMVIERLKDQLQLLEQGHVA
ncbi:glyoxalase [Robertkochia marina]|uniref:Glyoxalase n=1 Tax=Robertkochia marina TaxID=1227945 RepID=A0A4V6RRT4_9FLAO|nr:glyoxalase [Robertkochia marina]THD67916.1 glyoxalase [Robertkochia marina]TRZ41023.1 glyoxalase [Robertkochia marina]